MFKKGQGSLPYSTHSRSQGQMGSDCQNFERFCFVFLKFMSIWSFGDVVPGHRVRPGWHFITQSRAICDGIRTWARPLLVRLTGSLELTGALAACQPRTLTLASSCRLSTSPASTLNPTRSCCGTCGRRSPLCWMRPTPSEREYQKKGKKKKRADAFQ